MFSELVSTFCLIQDPRDGNIIGTFNLLIASDTMKTSSEKNFLPLSMIVILNSETIDVVFPAIEWALAICTNLYCCYHILKKKPREARKMGWMTH